MQLLLAPSRCRRSSFNMRSACSIFFWPSSSIAPGPGTGWPVCSLWGWSARRPFLTSRPTARLELMGSFVNTVHEFLHVFSGSAYLIALVLFPDGKLPPSPSKRWRPPAGTGRVLRTSRDLWVSGSWLYRDHCAARRAGKLRGVLRRDHPGGRYSGSIVSLQVRHWPGTSALKDADPGLDVEPGGGRSYSAWALGWFRRIHSVFLGRRKTP